MVVWSYGIVWYGVVWIWWWNLLLLVVGAVLAKRKKDRSMNFNPKYIFWLCLPPYYFQGGSTSSTIDTRKPTTLVDHGTVPTNHTVNKHHQVCFRLKDVEMCRNEGFSERKHRAGADRVWLRTNAARRPSLHPFAVVLWTCGCFLDVPHHYTNNTAVNIGV